MTFGTFGHAKVRQTQSYFKIKSKNQSSVNSQNKKSNLSSAFSFAIAAAKEKAIKKKTP
mgnify:CR=1 FL=1